MPKFEPLLYDL